MDVAYSLVAPLILVGVAGGLIFALVVPAVAPNFRRPFVAAWILSSICTSVAILVEELAISGRSPIESAARAFGVWPLRGLIVWVIRLRIHMWDHIDAAQKRKTQEEQTARYRPKNFSE